MNLYKDNDEVIMIIKLMTFILRITKIRQILVIMTLKLEIMSFTGITMNFVLIIEFNSCS